MRCDTCGRTGLPVVNGKLARHGTIDAGPCAGSPAPRRVMVRDMEDDDVTTTIDRALALARKHLGAGSMESSARLCLNYAVTARDDGKMDEARWWAARSIAYSVGVFHPDYVKVAPATSVGV